MPNGYRITAENVDGKLELHAYWDKAILTNPTTIASKRKAAIIKQEAKIARRSQLLLKSGSVLSCASSCYYFDCFGLDFLLYR